MLGVDIVPPIGFSAILPEFVLAVGGCAVLVLSQLRGGVSRAAAPWTMVGTIIVAALLVWLRVGRGDALSVAGSGLEFNALSDFVRISTLVVGLIIALVAWGQAQRNEEGEFYSMTLFALLGVMLVGAADDLVVLFLALELVSIPTYVLVALSRRQIAATESATKYFYLGAMSAAIMAYGFSFLYGVAGTTQITPEAIDRVASALSSPYVMVPAEAIGAPEVQAFNLQYALAMIGVLLTLAGLLFKIAAVPMQFYIADVYQGAASSVAGLLGFVPKLAGMVAIFKLAHLAGWQVQTSAGLFWVLWIVAALSMTYGNLLALRQTNIKRMLGYSGVAHAGYMLVGVIATPLGDGGRYIGDGLAAVLFYAVVYALANLAAFAILGLMRRSDGKPTETLRDVAGMVRWSPVSAVVLALAMFSLMGMPPTPGFWGKWSLFTSVVSGADASNPHATAIIWLVVIGVLNSAIGFAYYLRVISACLLYESDEPQTAAPLEARQMGASLCGLLLLIFSFFPGMLLNQGRAASGPFRTEVIGDAAGATQEVAPAPGATASRAGDGVG